MRKKCFVLTNRNIFFNIQSMSRRGIEQRNADRNARISTGRFSAKNMSVHASEAPTPEGIPVDVEALKREIRFIAKNRLSLQGRVSRR